ncbi:hypothetical protein OROMI_010096 [Orobanche minor]
MDFLSTLSKKNEPKLNPGGSDPTNPDHHLKLKPSQSDLIHSAKVVADVAQAHFRHQPEKYDKAEVAGATADLLSAAAEYGKLDDKGIGKYVDKAEGYLRHYAGSQSDGNSSDHKTAGGATRIAAGGEEHSGGGEGGGGAGDFLKNMAGDFLKK